MNEQLQLQLVSIIESIRTAVAASPSFAMEQLPDIAQQYVLYGRAVSLGGLFIKLIPAFILLYFAWWSYKNPGNSSRDSWDSGVKRREPYDLNVWVPAILGTIVALVSVMSSNYLVWFAPKVWLLQELAQLIK